MPVFIGLGLIFMNEETIVTTNKGSGNFLSLSILVAAFVIGGSLVYSANVRGGSDKPLAEVGATPGVDNNRSGGGAPAMDDDVILGNPEALVTLIEFGDYQCPFCKRMFDDTEKLLREEYIRTGKVKMVYRDFPLDQIHPYARGAAEAAECARDGGKYWAYHDALFTKQSEIPKLDYVKLAKELGLDSARFKACVDSGTYKSEVEADYQDGVKAGVRGTPASFINGQLLEGAQPYESFKRVIDLALQNASK